MITYRYTSAFVTDDFDRNDIADKAHTVPKFHLAVTGENNATFKSYRQGYLRLTSKMNLSVDEGRS